MRVLRVHLVENLDQQPGDGPVPVVLVVRGDYVPRCPWGGALRDGDAVGAVVVVPVSTLIDVGFVELPVLVRIAQAVEEPAALLVIGDVKADLDDLCAALDHLLLKCVDDPVAALNDRGLGQVMNSGDDYVLIVRSVEDADLTLLRQPFANAPEETMTALFRRRLFERRDQNPLRIHAADHMRDRAVLATGVHAL